MAPSTQPFVHGQNTLDSLDDYRWLNTPEAHQSFLELLETPNEIPSQLRLLKDSKVRYKRIELLRSQAAMQKACGEKFPDPQNWFWTKKHLEQSSDFWCAADSAQDIPADAPVVDLCSGAGADTIAIAAVNHAVESYDIDPIACLLLEGNAGRSILSLGEIRCHCEKAERATIRDDTFLHIDPDRRSGGARVTSSNDFLPSWAEIEPMLKRATGASIKVAPATRLTSDMCKPDVIRFLSRNRAVRQQRWLWNTNRWPIHSLVVSAFHKQSWHHEVFEGQLSVSSLASLSNKSMDLSRRIEHSSAVAPLEYVGDYDPAIRAAGVSEDFASRIGVSLLGPNGYLTSSSAVPHPMVRWFKVETILPMDRKKLVAFSRCTPAKLWELKSRGVEFPLDPLRKALITVPESGRELTMLFTKVGKKSMAIVADPI